MRTMNGFENYLRIKEWKERMVEKTVKAIKRAYPEAEIYLVGSVARGDFTAKSDIDLLIILPFKPRFRDRLPIYDELYKDGILPKYPIQLHLGDKETLEQYKRLGKVIKLG